MLFLWKKGYMFYNFGKILGMRDEIKPFPSRPGRKRSSAKTIELQ